MKKLILSLLIVLFCNNAAAQDLSQTSTIGQFTIISKNQIAIFDGVLLDPLAIATILSDKDFEKDDFKLKLDYQINKEKLSNKLTEDNLRLNLDFEKKRNNEILNIKNEQIKSLEKNQSSSIWPMLGSFALGAVTAVLVVMATK